MTAPTDQELLSLMTKGDFAAAMARRFYLHDEKDIRILQAACARLHNSGAWDLLGLVERGEIQALTDSDFFFAAHILDQILPELEAEPARVMTCVEALVARGGSDLAANEPNAALRSWCAKDPARARRIIDAARDGDALATRNLTFPLEALQATEEARRFLISDDNQHRLSAITALGRIPDTDADSRRATLAAFARLVDKADDVLRASLLRTTAFLLSQEGAKAGEAEIDLLRRLTAEAGDQVIHASAHVIWADRGARRPEVVPVLLRAIRGIKPTNKGTLKELDHSLRTLLVEGWTDAVLDFVRDLFSGPGELELTELEGFLQTLTNGSAAVLGRAVVSWLLTGEARLCEGLSKALRRDRDEAPVLTIDDAIRGLSGVEQLFICRKAIAWFFIKPRSAASVLVAVLRVCNDTTAAEVQRHLVQPLLINYSGLRDYLRSLDPADPARTRVDAALAENDAYLEALRSVPELRELYPSEAQRRVQRLRMADQSREIAKQARNQSVFLKLVKRSVLLHGHRSLSFISDPDGNLRRFEMDLHAHGVSFELPRMEIVDPIGLDYMLRVYRVERLAR